MPDKFGMRTIEEWEKILSPMQIRNAVFFNSVEYLNGQGLTLQECLEWLYGDREKVVEKKECDVVVPEV